MSILIKNGRVVTAADDYFADVFIEGEKVALIGKDLEVAADAVIDAKDRLVIPGGIDPHTHMDMPFGGTTSADDFSTGPRAAAFGGTTTIIDFAIQTQGRSALEGLETWHEKAHGKSCIDYSFHMILSDMPKERLGEIRRLVDEGITSYKMFMAYPGVLYADDGMLYRAYKEAAENASVMCMHAENGIVIDEQIREAVEAGRTGPEWHGLTRSEEMEAEAVHRSIAIAKLTGVPLYIVHLASAPALEQIKLGRAAGVDVTCETCPQYLFLDHSYYEREGFEGAKWVMSPALRFKRNQEPLWEGLRMGHILSTATDHCPFNFHGQKEMGLETFTKIPNGAPGVENRMALLYTGAVKERGMSLNRFVEITSTNAARRFGLYPRKGTVAVGSDADIVVWDPERRETISAENAFTHHMNVDYCAFEGFEVQGYAETVLSRGRIIVDKGEQKTETGGQFVKRATVGSLLR